MSGNCDFCGIWHSGPCCHPGRSLLDVKDAEIARLKECQASQREQLRLLEDLQDGEIAERVRLAEEASANEITRLKSQLAEVTKQNEEAQICAMENLGRFLCLAKQCPAATIPTQIERVLATMQATNAQFVKMRDELAEVAKELDAARRAECRAIAECDTLRAALRQCGEALRTWKMAGGQADVLHAALALPAVRAAMEDSNAAS